MRPFSGLTALLAIVVGPAAMTASPAQEAKIQPDRLDFGRVVAGATAEGSVLIFRKEARVEGLEATATAPPGVTIQRTEVNRWENGKTARGVCDLWVALDTAEVRAIDGSIRVQVGDEAFEVPIRARVVAPKPGAPRVLVCNTPFQRFSTSDAAMFDPWLRLAAAAELDVHYRGSDNVPGRAVFRDDDRDRFDVVLLGQEGLLALKEADIAALKAFAEGGGRIVLTANYFFRGTTEKANVLLKPYGLVFGDVEPEGVSEFTFEGDEIRGDRLTRGGKSFFFHRPSPVLLVDAKLGTLLVTPKELPDVGFVGVGRAGKGEVVAIGQSLWWSWIAKDRAKGSTNAALLRNLLATPPTRD